VVSVVFGGGGGLQISSATPAVITDRRALYACASRVLSLLHNTLQCSKGREKMRPQPSNLKLGGGRKDGKCPWVLSFRDVTPGGENAEGKEGFF
jgi:hypothetical protein